jgi:hypothetical protein
MHVISAVSIGQATRDSLWIFRCETRKSLFCKSSSGTPWAVNESYNAQKSSGAYPCGIL